MDISKFGTDIKEVIEILIKNKNEWYSIKQLYHNIDLTCDAGYFNFKYYLLYYCDNIFSFYSSLNDMYIKLKDDNYKQLIRKEKLNKINKY